MNTTAPARGPSSDQKIRSMSIRAVEGQCQWTIGRNSGQHQIDNAERVTPPGFSPRSVSGLSGYKRPTVPIITSDYDVATGEIPNNLPDLVENTLALR